jgi:hypothetical protein
MKFFLVDTLGEGDDDALVLDQRPVGMKEAGFLIPEGERVGDKFPKDARMNMSSRYDGFRLDSLIGNTIDYLILSRDAKEVVEEHCKGAEIEYLPFVLYNLKNRVQSGDYFIVNPIGGVDCLNSAASDITYLDAPGEPEHGEIVDIDTFVFDPGKLKNAPALFRVEEQRTAYVISEKLADAFQQRGFTNIVLTEIEQQGGK